MLTGKDLFDWIDREIWGIEPPPETIEVDAVIDVKKDKEQRRSRLRANLASRNAIQALTAKANDDDSEEPVSFGQLLRFFGYKYQGVEESTRPKGKFYIWYETFTGEPHNEIMFNITFFLTSKPDTDYYDFTGYCEEGALRRLLSQFNVRELSWDSPCVEFAELTWRA